MKLEPIFTTKNNRLIKIEDNSIIDISTIQKINIPWTTVEMEEGYYNEEFLATLRDQLKKNELIKKYVILVPIVDKQLENNNQIEQFINAFNHTARRIKDCTCVVGFELPLELKAQQEFIDTLSVKHSQYIYFSKAENSQLSSVITY